MDHDVDHFILFQILLTSALKARDTKKLGQIWDVMPHGFGIFDLLAVIRHYLSEALPEDSGTEEKPAKVLAEREEEILMVEVFRPQLLKMWNASQQGENV